MEFRIGIIASHPVRILVEANVLISDPKNIGNLGDAIKEQLIDLRPDGLKDGEIFFLERL